MNWTFFKELLSIDSTSGKERKVAEWLLTQLEAPVVESMEVGDGTLNLFLKWGTPKVVFCTHMDTVPPYIGPCFPEEMLSRGTPFASLSPAPPTASAAGPSPYPCAGVHMSSGEHLLRITGRGSCDAKGQLFAMYTSCKELEASGCTDFGLLLLAGEETGSWGAKAFSKTGFQAPFLIVGEPTENKMVSASKGTKSYDLTFHGEAFHSGYPQYGVSAVDLFNTFYNQLKAKDFGEDPVLGATTWNVGLVHSDNPQNILSPELSCRLYFRTTFVSDQPVQDWMQAIGRCPVVAGHDGSEAAGPSVTPDLIGGLTVTARGGDAPARYVTLPGFKSAPVAFGSDAPHLTGFGHKIICGPGTICVAHRPDEHVLVRDLEIAVDQYVKMYREIQSI